MQMMSAAIKAATGDSLSGLIAVADMFHDKAGFNKWIAEIKALEKRAAEAVNRHGKAAELDAMIELGKAELAKAEHSAADKINNAEINASQIVKKADGRAKDIVGAAEKRAGGTLEAAAQSKREAADTMAAVTQRDEESQKRSDETAQLLEDARKSATVAERAQVTVDKLKTDLRRRVRLIQEAQAA